MRLKKLFNESPSDLPFRDDHELAHFLRGLRNADGSWKTTRPQRHAAANKLLIEQLVAAKAHIRCVFDVGVSSGITTSELIHDLHVAGLVPVEVVAVDRYFDVSLVRIAKDFFAVTDQDGHVLRLEAGSLNFSPWCSTRDFLTGAAIIKNLIPACEKPTREALRGAERRFSTTDCSPPLEAAFAFVDRT